MEILRKSEEIEGALLSMGSLLYFYSLKYLPAGIATLLFLSTASEKLVNFLFNITPGRAVFLALGMGDEIAHFAFYHCWTIG